MEIYAKHQKCREFQSKTNLYEVEPLGRVYESWMNLSDVSDKKKARILDFDELKGKKLYAQYVRENDKTYWKMYIVDHTTINTLYVETSALNPIRLHKP